MVHPDVRRLLVTPDGGGSNGGRTRAEKVPVRDMRRRHPFMGKNRLNPRLDIQTVLRDAAPAGIDCSRIAQP